MATFTAGSSCLSANITALRDIFNENGEAKDADDNLKDPDFVISASEDSSSNGDDENENENNEIFPDWYHFEHHKVAKRSLGPSLEHHENLMNESQVKWARQQIVKSRQKRDLLPFRQKSYRVNLNDPRWPQMWYLNRGQAPDMNVQPAWIDGITGVGVVVTILDDGLEKDHPDLFRNYDPQASYDVNNHDEDPMPRYDLIDSNRHGTRCAGEVAATANNSLCAVGVAYGASVGGVRMLDGDVTDAVEARSLSLNPQHIDIYSASWGPDDDGKTVDGPGELATRAFIEGVTKGRSGKGSIFVWASGNGGRDHDNCNCDGYTNSIWTLSISSATENGYVPWYSEACSSTLATTYSSGATGEKQVVTTDLHHQCTSSHTGTSASAPLAAGICALALESNRELTWRDMQHIVVRTARPANLKSPDWKVNGVGRNVSHSFGYGLMDAYAMVKLARNWKTVPEQHKCEVSAPHTDKLIPAKSHVSLQLNVRECAGVNFLEHVQAKVSLVSSRRGDLQIHLTSPAGTRSTLLARRPHDVSRAGFQAWPFMSVHTWGEKPFGVWQLEIHNEGRFLGTLSGWKMVFYGTETSPGGEEHEDDEDLKFTDKNTPVNPGGILSSNENDPQHNAVEPVTGGQWKDIHKVESPDHTRNEVQRTTTEDDVSSASAGCLAFSKKGQHCIGGGLLKLLDTRSLDWSQLSQKDVKENLRGTTQHYMNECVKGMFLYEGRCEAVCPEKHFSTLNEESQAICSCCHYTCNACIGPNDYECISCYGDAVLKYVSKTESYCFPKALLSALETNKWFYWMFIAFVANVTVLVLIMVYFLTCKLIKNSYCCKTEHDYSKMKSGTNDLDSKSALYDLSDSENDT